MQIIGYDSFVKTVETEGTVSHRDEMKKKAVPIRAILVTERSVEELKKHFLETIGESFQFKVVSPNDFPFKVEGEITIRADYVHMFTYALKPLTIEIRSSVLADTYRALFEVAWDRN